MCNAWSGIVMEDGKVHWKWAVDSHADIISEAGLKDDTVPPSFAKVEISPANKNYLAPDKWTFRLDEECAPEWWTPKHEQFAWGAFRQWKQKINRCLMRKPIVHPFRDVKPPRKITRRHLELLKQWASVGDSVGASVWASVGDGVRASVWASVGDGVGDSVGASVRASVGDSVGASVRASVRASVWASVGASVWDSVWASVGASVWASVWAYAGSFFALPRKAWKYTENITAKGYPFQPCVDLWNLGLVPSFDGTAWRLHGGKDAKVLREGKI